MVEVCPQTQQYEGSCPHVLCLPDLCSPNRAPPYSTVQKECAYAPLPLALSPAVTVTLQALATKVLHQLPTSLLKQSRQTSLNQQTMGRKSFDPPT